MKPTQRRLHSYRLGRPLAEIASPVLSGGATPWADEGGVHFETELAGWQVEISLPARPGALLLSTGAGPCELAADDLGRVRIAATERQAPAALLAVADALGRLPETRGLQLVVSGSGGHAPGALAAAVALGPRTAALVLDRDVAGPLCLAPTYVGTNPAGVSSFIRSELARVRCSALPPRLDRRTRRLLARRLERRLRRDCRRRSHAGLTGRVRAGLAGLATALAFTLSAGIGTGLAQAAYTGSIDPGGASGDDLFLTDDSSSTSMTVTCSAGKMQFNGSASVPGLPATINCSSIATFEVLAEGGNDSVDLGGVTAANFTSLTSSLPVNVRGGDGKDTIQGAGDIGSVLRGDDGADTIVGGAAGDSLDGDQTSGRDSDDDALDGGGGTDTLTQIDSTPGSISYDLTNSSLVGAGQDDIVNIERALIRTGAGNNELDASGFSIGSVTLDGQGGSDTLHGSGGFFNDSLVGGAGTDRVEEAGSWHQQADHQHATDRVQGTDALSGIEQASLTGTAGNDFLTASNFTGTVTLAGLGGDDQLRGGTGADQIIGGSGGETAGDRIITSVDADQTVGATQLTIGGQGTDTFSDVEIASLTGGSGANELDATGFTGTGVSLTGQAGDDTLRAPISAPAYVNGSIDNDLFIRANDADMTFNASNQVTVSGIGVDTLFRRDRDRVADRWGRAAT